MLLMLLVSSCGDDYKEKIQGEWYADFTEQAGAGMSTVLSIDFSENYMNMKIDFPDVVYVDIKGGYEISGNEITPLLKNSKPEIGINSKLESLFQGMTGDNTALDMFKSSMEKEFSGKADFLGDMGKLTIEEVTDSKLVLKDEQGESLTLRRDKPMFKSALPDFKKMTGL